MKLYPTALHGTINYYYSAKFSFTIFQSYKAFNWKIRDHHTVFFLISGRIKILINHTVPINVFSILLLCSKWYKNYKTSLIYIQIQTNIYYVR